MVTPYPTLVSKEQTVCPHSRSSRYIQAAGRPQVTRPSSTILARSPRVRPRSPASSPPLISSATNLELLEDRNPTPSLYLLRPLADSFLNKGTQSPVSQISQFPSNELSQNVPNSLPRIRQPFHNVVMPRLLRVKPHPHAPVDFYSLFIPSRHPNAEISTSRPWSTCHAHCATYSRPLPRKHRSHLQSLRRSAFPVLKNHALALGKLNLG